MGYLGGMAQQKPDIVLDENALVAFVAAWLKTEGFHVKQALTTKQKGIDIVAERGPETWLIEAKGATSSRVNSPRFGRSFSSQQAYNRIAKAFYTGAKLAAENRKPDIRILLAIPDHPMFLRFLKPIQPTFETLKIGLLLVNAAGSVRSL